MADSDSNKIVTDNVVSKDAAGPTAMPYLSILAVKCKDLLIFSTPHQAKAGTRQDHGTAAQGQPNRPAGIGRADMAGSGSVQPCRRPAVTASPSS
ncbi:hypothetical protein [Hoeflea olei]|uniref:hypothetical protein n=1 Tax=Hoeflea olei TaxID=1480615 RepID=UPI001112BD92|nr:hypothetical protein [Hoeflea olei]